MIFIIVHQAYELWFKLILYEIDSVIELFSECLDQVGNVVLATIVKRLSRIVEILKLMVEMVTIIETIAPIDFANFRDQLKPASGFQSFQFRIIENKLGLPSKTRVNYQGSDYVNYFKSDHQKILKSTQDEVSLFSAVQHWLEKMTDTTQRKAKVFDFWTEFQKAASALVNQANEAVISSQTITGEQDLKGVQRLSNTFEQLFDETQFNKRKLSHRATQSALLINHYPEFFHTQSRVLTLLTEIDEQIVSWKARHLFLAQRMIGTKFGSTDHTSSTSGYMYLRSTMTDRYNIFGEITNLSTYLIPRHFLPDLPQEFAQQYHA